MSGIGILLLLTAAAVLPLVVAFILFKAAKSRVTLPWFLTAMASGIISLLAAALIQSLFPQPGISGLGEIFFGVFIRVAMVEEAGRLLTLVPLVYTAKRLRGTDDITFAAALGLTAGLGFAAAENAFYGMSDINITLLRVFTAAPLHGACGIRAAAAVSAMKQSPAKGVFLFASAVIIHGAYNLMIVIPAVPSPLAVAVALLALLSSLQLLKADAGVSTGP